MPAMKLTPNAAMRARDVSRPRAEHLAEAEAAEAGPHGNSRDRTVSGDAAKGYTGREGPVAADWRGPGTGGETGKELTGGTGIGGKMTGGTGTGGTGTGGTGKEAPAGDERTGRPGYPRRRRGSRDAGRRGRSSR